MLSLWKALRYSRASCGVAIVLELARIMSKYEFNHTVAFALWNGEEISRLGSNSYAKYAADNSLKIPLYFNFDSTCYDPEDRFILDIMYKIQFNAHDCTADYLSFWSGGYPAVMIDAVSFGYAMKISLKKTK